MPLDTDTKAQAIQDEILRRMSPVARVNLAFEMSDFVREVALAGLRKRHPELGPQKLKRKLLQVMYGDLARP